MIWDFLLLNLSYDDFLLSNEDEEEEERIQILIEGGNLNEEEQIEIYQEEYQEEQQEEQQEEELYIIEIKEPITFEYKRDNNIITALAV